MSYGKSRLVMVDILIDCSDGSMSAYQRLQKGIMDKFYNIRQTQILMDPQKGPRSYVLHGTAKIDPKKYGAFRRAVRGYRVTENVAVAGVKMEMEA